MGAMPAWLPPLRAPLGESASGSNWMRPTPSEKPAARACSSISVIAAGLWSVTEASGAQAPRPAPALAWEVVEYSLT